jgi:hypothetical protein
MCDADLMSTTPEPVSLPTLKAWLSIPYPVHVSREITDWMRVQIAALVDLVDDQEETIRSLDAAVVALGQGDDL